MKRENDNLVFCWCWKYDNEKNRSMKDELQVGHLLRNRVDSDEGWNKWASER